MSAMIARGGRAFVAAGAVGSALALPFSTAGFIGLVTFTAFLAFVFRDPRRVSGEGIVAPADGVVREVDPEKGLVSTYLALRNVHVTRVPVDGTVESALRSKGGHAPAFSGKVERNERVDVRLRTSIGTVDVVLMAGALARRIVPYIGAGEVRRKGDRLGLIRFGSRVDLYLPNDRVRILVEKGQRIRAGVTMVAEVLDGNAG